MRIFELLEEMRAECQREFGIRRSHGKRQTCKVKLINLINVVEMGDRRLNWGTLSGYFVNEIG